MRRFYTGVVRHRRLILVLFILAAAVCLLLQRMVAVNYDVNDYLPAGTASTVSIDVMEREFDGAIPNARVMIRDVTVPEALEYKARLAAIPGVTAVTTRSQTVGIRPRIKGAMMMAHLAPAAVSG